MGTRTIFYGTSTTLPKIFSSRMFKIYQTQVREDLNKKLFERTLSSNITAPDLRKIKQECLTVYKKRFLSIDIDLVHAFFGEPDEDGDFSGAIENTAEERFLPLVIWLRHTVYEPQVITIELLAWLIDYEQRPFINPHKRLKDGTYQDYQTLDYNQHLLTDEVPLNVEWWQDKKLQIFFLTCVITFILSAIFMSLKRLLRL
jgi:hypothetical protein